MPVDLEDVRVDRSDALLPVLVTPETAVDLAAWAADRRLWIDEMLSSHGALLFRGFSVSSEAAFQRIAMSMCGALLDYVYRSTPRTSVVEKVYTATEYRADASIPLHNENSYQREWPLKILFCCLQPASEGGETPLALTRRVTDRIGADLLREFGERQIMYVRNYGHGVDLSWQAVFQTDDPAVVDAYCRQQSISCEWLGEGRLRTKQVCHAVARRPVTGEALWFNQLHLFHASSMGAETYALMKDLFGEPNLPRQAYYGDGEPIREETLEHIRRCYDAEARTFVWQQGDVLLLDNMLVAHGRAPYAGARRVLVAMGDVCSSLGTTAPASARA